MAEDKKDNTKTVKEVTLTEAIYQDHKNRKLENPTHVLDTESVKEPKEENTIYVSKDMEPQIINNSIKSRVRTLFNKHIEKELTLADFGIKWSEFRNKLWDLIITDEYRTFRDTLSFYFSNNSPMPSLYKWIKDSTSEDISDDFMNYLEQWLEHNIMPITIDYIVTTKKKTQDVHILLDYATDVVSEFIDNDKVQNLRKNTDVGKVFSLLTDINKNDHKVSKAIRNIAFTLYNFGMPIHKTDNDRNFFITMAGTLISTVSINHLTTGNIDIEVVTRFWNNASSAVGDYAMGLNISREDFNDSGNMSASFERAVSFAYQIYNKYKEIVNEFINNQEDSGLKREAQKYYSERNFGFKEEKQEREPLAADESFTAMQNRALTAMRSMLTIIHKKNVTRSQFVNTSYEVTKTVLKEIIPELEGANSIFYTLIAKTFWVNNRELFSSFYNNLYDATTTEEIDWIIGKMTNKWYKHLKRWVKETGPYLLEKLDTQEAITKINNIR